MLIIKERIEEKKVFDEEDALKLMEDSTGSLRYLKRVIIVKLKVKLLSHLFLLLSSFKHKVCSLQA